MVVPAVLPGLKERTRSPISCGEGEGSCRSREGRDDINNFAYRSTNLSPMRQDAPCWPASTTARDVA